MISNYRIIIPFNARFDDGCDYATQTIKLLAKKNEVIAIPMAHEENVWTLLSRFFTQRTFYSNWQGAKIFTPLILIPFRRFFYLKKLNYLLTIFIFKLILQISGESRKEPPKKLLWFFEPHFSELWLQFFDGWPLLYDCVDYWFGFTGQIAKQNELLIQKADWVVVNSQALLGKIKPMRPDVNKVPLGFAADEFVHQSHKLQHIAAKKRLSRSHPNQKIFGFVGQIGNRFDFQWLFSLIEAFPKDRFVFIGATWVWRDLDTTSFLPYLQRLKQYHNCEFLPPVPKRQIPDYISQFDVGLIPYDTKQIFNYNCNPLKLYEYWYFGKPVVATDIFELSFYPQVLIATNTAKLAVTWIKSLFATGFSQARVVKKLALANSWQAKLTAISQVIVSNHYQ